MKWLLLTTIVFTTPEKEMTAVITEPKESKAICMNHKSEQPSINFMGVISMKVIQTCVEEKHGR
tara:strand:+ start:323 stop:514 length:192 start_codon:yes stop_codon:yes gene_type:complete